jgi:hypothetical protein
MVMNTRNIEVFLSAAEVAQESSGEGRGKARALSAKNCGK